METNILYHEKGVAVRELTSALASSDLLDPRIRAALCDILESCDALRIPIKGPNPIEVDEVSRHLYFAATLSTRSKDQYNTASFAHRDYQSGAKNDKFMRFVLVPFLSDPNGNQGLGRTTALISPKNACRTFLDVFEGEQRVIGDSYERIIEGFENALREEDSRKRDGIMHKTTMDLLYLMADIHGVSMYAAYVPEISVTDASRLAAKFKEKAEAHSFHAEHRFGQVWAVTGYHFRGNDGDDSLELKRLQLRNQRKEGAEAFEV